MAGRIGKMERCLVIIGGLICCQPSQQISGELCDNDRLGAIAHRSHESEVEETSVIEYRISATWATIAKQIGV